VHPSLCREFPASLKEKKVSRKWHKDKEIITRCCSCQKILNEDGAWQDLAESSGGMNGTLFSHSLCPDCLVILYPELVFPAAPSGKKKSRVALSRR